MRLQTRKKKKKKKKKKKEKKKKKKKKRKTSRPKIRDGERETILIFVLLFEAYPRLCPL